jgi:hypothetical protein
MTNTAATTTQTTTHNHYAARDIDPTCTLCAVAQTFRPLADLEATWATYTNDLLEGRRCKNCGSAGHTFCNR